MSRIGSSCKLLDASCKLLAEDSHIKHDIRHRVSLMMLRLEGTGGAVGIVQGVDEVPQLASSSFFNTSGFMQCTHVSYQIRTLDLS